MSARASWFHACTRSSGGGSSAKWSIKIIGIVERGVSDQFRAQLRRVVVARNVDERARLVGAAQRHAELVDGGPVLVFAKPRDVRVAVGPVVEPLQQRCGGPIGGRPRDDNTGSSESSKPCAVLGQLHMHPIRATRLAGDSIRARKIRRKSGAGERTRTADLLITNQLLYQLSYAGFLPRRVPPERRVTATANHSL